MSLVIFIFVVGGEGERGSLNLSFCKVGGGGAGSEKEGVSRF